MIVATITFQCQLKINIPLSNSAKIGHINELNSSRFVKLFIKIVQACLLLLNNCSRHCNFRFHDADIWILYNYFSLWECIPFLIWTQYFWYMLRNEVVILTVVVINLNCPVHSSPHFLWNWNNNSIDGHNRVNRFYIYSECTMGYKCK